MKNKLLQMVILVLFSLTGLSAFASGFFIADSPGNSLGAGSIGVANPTDASAVFYNPAGLTKLKKNNALISSTFFYFPKGEFTRKDDEFAKFYDDQYYIDKGIYTEENSPKKYGDKYVYKDDAGDYHYKSIGLAKSYGFGGYMLAFSTDALPIEGLRLGLVTNNLFGARIEFPNDGPNQYMMRLIDFRTVQISPAVAYEISPNLSIGFGLSIQKADLQMLMNTDMYTFINRLEPESESQKDFQELGKAFLNSKQEDPEYAVDTKMELDDWGFSGNIGLLLSLDNLFGKSDALNIGFQYHLPVSFELSGKTRMNYSDKMYELMGEMETNSKALYPDRPEMQLSAGENPAVIDTSMDLELPQYFRFGVKYQVLDQLAVLGGCIWMNWAVFEKYYIELGANPLKENAGLDHLEYPKNWENAWTFQFGLDYAPVNTLHLMLGYFYDETPIKDEYLMLDYPGNDKNAITTQAVWNINQTYTVSAGAVYFLFEKRDITNNVQQPPVNGKIDVTFSMMTVNLSAVF